MRHVGEVLVCPECIASVVEEDEQQYDDEDYCDEPDSEPCGSCDECGADIFPDEDDGSGLCDQCSFYAELGEG
jgi:hypothetical protein